ncbi:MAG: TIGR01777 family protein [Cytophagia bacterium]|nr:TIGR01777 family protein [Cytophagia bacterium]
MQHKIGILPHNRPVVLISGGSGLIGTALAIHLAEMGCEARILGRQGKNQPMRNPKVPSAQGVELASPGKITHWAWNPSLGQVDKAALEGISHAVNLAGAGIAEKAWTTLRRKELFESRTRSAAFLKQILAERPQGSVERIVTASAIGYYPTGEDLAIESSPRGQGFLALLTQAWEQSTEPLNTIAPLTTLRIGLVLSARGGLLGPLLPVTRLGLGASVGNGRQWMSWIHEEDMVRMIAHALFTPNWSPGIYNAVAPLPRRHLEFMRSLADAVHRPLWLAVPAWPLRWIMGERADLLLNGVKASSQKTMDAGFTFSYPDLRPALMNLLHP